MYLSIFLRTASACSVGKIQRRLQGKFVLIVKFIMQNSNLFVAESIHQDHEIFSDISTGRQCSFVSFSALLRAQIEFVAENSTASIVDEMFSAYFITK